MSKIAQTFIIIHMYLGTGLECAQRVLTGLLPPPRRASLSQPRAAACSINLDFGAPTPNTAARGPCDGPAAEGCRLDSARQCSCGLRPPGLCASG